ncbi:hypothetical protein DACRYDRAFT_25385 [Dacryopinax primogenitus]|uniref:Uncharacterized protein n=1 Tax=Dacryopinax primogenitus (strain DJM 731) TaxID=1858805 RepID=M5FUL5_DACPD|nr:uncharacterized protein DACRYDRAFT_25385 [Dacryopinax primogenitus]EJT96946.1 hypothetical protein DACRYDRAFT_25385 [Dacryopinax primogenitus]
MKCVPDVINYTSETTSSSRIRSRSTDRLGYTTLSVDDSSMFFNYCELTTRRPHTPATLARTRQPNLSLCQLLRLQLRRLPSSLASPEPITSIPPNDTSHTLILVVNVRLHGTFHPTSVIRVYDYSQLEPSVILLGPQCTSPVFHSDISDAAFWIRMILSITGCVHSFSILLGNLSDQLPCSGITRGSFPLYVVPRSSASLWNQLTARLVPSSLPQVYIFPPCPCTLPHFTVHRAVSGTTGAVEFCLPRFMPPLTNCNLYRLRSGLSSKLECNWLAGRYVVHSETSDTIFRVVVHFPSPLPIVTFSHQPLRFQKTRRSSSYGSLPRILNSPETRYTQDPVSHPPLADDHALAFLSIAPSMTILVQSYTPQSILGNISASTCTA